MSVDFSDYLNEQLQDEDFRREYEVAEFEYELSQAVIEAPKKAGIKPSDLRRIEDYQIAPSLEMLQQLARSMGRKLRLEFEPA